MEAKQNVERYDSIDGLRAFSSTGIVMMHVLSNGAYGLAGFIPTRLIPSFSSLVFLFMIISGFSLCCGYFERVSTGSITPREFYTKRFARIWPFFALLTMVDLIFSPSVDSLFEAFANLTLCFGLLPNPNIQVIGVGWTLGVIFVFYLLFPFFCFLLADKKRAWLSFIVAFIYNWMCSTYFFDSDHMLGDFSHRVNILYCAIYFIAGGMIFLYRDILSKLAKRFRLLILVLIGVIGGCYYFLYGGTFVLLALYSLILVYVLDRKQQKGVLNNAVTQVLGKYSMEIYLSHMMIYRVIEKLGFHKLSNSQTLSYVVALLLTLVGTVLFSILSKWCFEKARHINASSIA